MGADTPSGTSTTFNNATPPEMATMGPEKRIAAAQIDARGYEVSAKVEAHYLKHRTEWIKDEHDKLWLKEGNTPECKPKGAAGRDLKAKAAINVAQRHAVRQARVLLVKRSMIRDLDKSGPER